MKPLKLLIAADDPLVRAGLAMLLADAADCDVVEQMSTDTLEVEWPDLDDDIDVVIWDIGWEVPIDLPDWEEVPLPVIALMPEAAEIERVWAAGVRAFLPRQIDVERLLAAAYTAVHGLVVFDPAFSSELAPSTNDFEAEIPFAEALTPREKEVLQYVAEGLTNKAIGQKLHISDHTVKFHVNAVMTKLSAQSRTEAVVKATRYGLILL